MNEGKENLITVFLIILIIAVIGGFGFIAFKIFEPSPNNQNIANLNEVKKPENINKVDNENVIDEKNTVNNEVNNEISNTVDNTIENENEVEENTTEEVDSQVPEGEELVNLLAIKKYTENGIVKFQNNGFEKIYEKTRMLYNCEHTMYTAKFDYPASWNQGSKSLEGGLQFVYAGDKTKFVISEINIDEKQGLDTTEALGLVEAELKDYIAPLGNRYSATEFKTEIYGEGNDAYKALTYNYTDGVYNYKCFTRVKIGNPYMYVLTVAIPNEEFNEDNIEIKNNILDSFEII